MLDDPFATPFEALPASLPLFPLTGALLLPGGRIPLNIFEPRYLNMTFDSLRDARMIGMIQPRVPDPGDNSGLGEHGSAPDLYATGCAGRVAAFSEATGGRLVITLLGVCRFTVGDVIETTRGYRRAQVDFSKYSGDLKEPSAECGDRDRLIAALREYFNGRGLDVDWDAIEEINDHMLVTSLAMSCPFEPQEKQALLECGDLRMLTETMITILEMGVTPSGVGDAPTPH